MIEHDDPVYLDICTELVHSLTTTNDLISRLSTNRLAMLVADKGDAAEQIFHVIQSMIKIYPWARKGLAVKQPIMYLQDILTFPFTLEQLEENRAEAS
jgi:hypothetical protein